MTAQGWAWTGPERSTLVLGPSRSGKTSSIIIPNVLSARGAVVSTSTKPDVMGATAKARSEEGWTFLYDPSGTVEVPRGVTSVGWSPVLSARSWDGALVTADAMVRSHSRTAVTTPAESHWSERATALLGPLLHAGALAELPLSRVLSWVDRHDGAPALEILCDRVGEQTPPSDLLAGILTTDTRELSGIWSTTSGVLAAYRSSGALKSTEPPYLDPVSFTAGANTLYICASGRRQQLLSPLVVGVLEELRDAAYQRALGGASSPPVLFALDEVANIAPIPDLPALVSEGAGQGLLTLASLQDLSQARARWGPSGDSFLSLFGTTVVLPGIADPQTLELISRLGGDREVPTRSLGISTVRRGRPQRSTTASTVFRPRLPADEIARGRPGTALVIDPQNRIGHVTLTPAHRAVLWRDATAPGIERRRGSQDRSRSR
jgi:type IV secretion system protein VirD4